jgi:cytochrome c oxidase cbb3-type subunit 3
MSDFFNRGWAIYVAAVTLLGLAFCLALLLIAARRRVMADDNTTGHVWDEDLRELNNPLPRWWMWLFVATIAFSGAYLALYPGLGSLPGSLGWTSRGQFESEAAHARAEAAPIYAGFEKMTAAQLAQDPKAMAIGERLFANTCAQCHGSDAKGSKGFPNLTDEDWLGGDGSPEYITQTIINGRQGVMPSMAAAVGSDEDIHHVANYVLSLSGDPHDEREAALGRKKFTVCAACHGMDGKGNKAIGAPNLTDSVWLHGWGEDAIVAMIVHGKTNTMPPQGSRLTPEQVHVLAAYVWHLSHATTATADAAAH